MLLSNDRVRLRALEPEDLELLYRWENDPELWEVGNTLAPYSRYILKEYIAGSDRSIYESRQLRFMIEDCDTGTSVGIVDLFDFEPHPNRAACGIMLDRKYQGRGFATEALRLLMEYAYTFLKLHQLYVHIPVANEPSKKLFTRLGFVLNKKTDLIVNSFFKEFAEFPEIPIYLGGPVSPNRLFFIHSLGDNIIPDALKINDYLYFDGDFNALKRYILNGHPIDGKVKFFLGYSGWTEGQLNHEIKRNSWAVSHITTDNILSADGEGYWKDSVELLGNDYKTWTKYPKDPYLN